jgi:hypothetical protein
VSTATALRVGAGCLEAAAARTPRMLRYGVQATAGRTEAELAFRDEVVGLMRDASERTWRELRRGIDDFDAITRTDVTRTARRAHRVKP